MSSHDSSSVSPAGFKVEVANHLVAKYRMVPQDARACVNEWSEPLVTYFYESWLRGDRAAEVKRVADEIIEKLEWAGEIYIRTAKNQR